MFLVKEGIKKLCYQYVHRRVHDCLRVLLTDKLYLKTVVRKKKHYAKLCSKAT